VQAWVRVDPTNPLAHSSFGKFLLDAPETSGIRDLQAGLKNCKNAYDMDKMTGIIVRNYATALMQNKQYDQAAEIANEALKVSVPAKLPFVRKLMDQI
jgi:tetratricopeptide (TPR) repeat protein